MQAFDNSVLNEPPTIPVKIPEKDAQYLHLPLSESQVAVHNELQVVTYIINK
jgi:hypothetical protein